MKTVLIVLLAVVAMAAAQGKVHVVENADQGGTVINNPDPSYYQPSNGPIRQQPGYEPISIEPAYVENQRYPAKQFNDPRLRGGK